VPLTQSELHNAKYTVRATQCKLDKQKQQEHACGACLHNPLHRTQVTKGPSVVAGGWEV
jgi:hypothetical protein